MLGGCKTCGSQSLVVVGGSMGVANGINLVSGATLCVDGPLFRIPHCLPSFGLLLFALSAKLEEKVPLDAASVSQSLTVTSFMRRLSTAFPLGECYLIAEFPHTFCLLVP